MRVVGFLGYAGVGKDTAANFVKELRKEGGVASVACADLLKELVRLVFDFNHTQVYGTYEEKNAPDRRYQVYRMEKKVREAVRSRETFDLLTQIAPTASLSKIRRIWDSLEAKCVDIALDSRNGGLIPRKPLQLVGTEWGRDEIDADVWIYAAMNKAESFRKEAAITCITDLRFLNEARAVRYKGELVCEIVRPGYDGKNGATKGGVAQHRSELDQGSAEIRQYINYTINNKGSLSDLKREVEAFLKKYDL